MALPRMAMKKVAEVRCTKRSLRSRKASSLPLTGLWKTSRGVVLGASVGIGRVMGHRSPKESTILYKTTEWCDCAAGSSYGTTMLRWNNGRLERLRLSGKHARALRAPAGIDDVLTLIAREHLDLIGALTAELLGA